VRADKRFLNQPKHFWANVRSVSQHLGYTERGAGTIKVPSLPDVARALAELGLKTAHIMRQDGKPTELGENLTAYFRHRATVLYDVARPHLMDVAKAKAMFDKLRGKLKSQCPVPLNKQKGDKRTPAYFTGIINMLIEANGAGLPCNYSPMELTAVTVDGAPLRTLARRVDGAFPSTVNPIAIWEIKEYYHTTTFGSRIADGVYESLLDGMELEELREHERIDVKHYLMVDAYNTWWNMGRPFLCRIVDMLHMNYVDEVLFGSEVSERLPTIVREWVQHAKERPEYRKKKSKGPKS
jgi:hypothetical protein